jgi:5-methylcytosine-specific restriction endonuclease McrA
VAEWKAIRQQVLSRAGWRCQACGVRRRLDVHHVVKRSRGGSDFDLDQLVALCRWCHDQTDAPYERGRLVVTAVGAGRFAFEVVHRESKWEFGDRSLDGGAGGQTQRVDV